MKRLILVLISFVNCHLPYADFEARNPKQEFNRVVERAKRISNDDDSTCENIGVVHASGRPEDVMPALADEAAANGGTHYVIHGDADEVSLETRGVAVRNDNFAVMRAKTRAVHERSIWATVYRCQ